MEQQAENALNAMRDGFEGLGALAVQYAFSVFGAVMLIIIGYLIAGVLERGLEKALGRVPGFDKTLSQFFARVGRYIVLVMVLVMVLGQFGVQTASIIAAIGAIGLAVGLALQGTLQNIAAGIMLLVLRPFRVGEYIEIGQVHGTVEEIGLFATRLQTLDGIFILAPNGKLWDEPVYNYTRNPSRRNDLTIGIGYDDDINLAQQTMLDLAAADPRVLKHPAATATVTALGDSAIDVTLRYWTNIGDFLATKVELTKAAKLAFDEQGISIPFPQQEVVYREPAAAPAKPAKKKQSA